MATQVVAVVSAVPEGPAMTARSATTKSVKTACDKLCREIVRLRGACQACGTSESLECAHIRPRRFVGDPDGMPLRSDPGNCWLLCSSCHRRVDTDQAAFMLLVERTIGRDRFAQLVTLSHAAHRPWRKTDWQAERIRLKGLLESARNWHNETEQTP